MRRIYESEALRRDDEDSFSPGEQRDRSHEPLAVKMVPSTWLSRVFVPHWLRYRSIKIDVTSPRNEYPVEADVPFLVRMRNVMPFPVTVPVRSPVLWTWDVDGVTEASHVDLKNPPDEERGFVFERGEEKVFRKRWTGTFRVSESEWEPAGPGKYVIGAGLNVEDAEGKGLYSRTTVRLVPE
ncbi:hypothetical protein AArcSl_2059 [Halalkaliarchaeum desulfuricum]|uniref:DUF7974 domain-containing protein n=1 Tax=Halalkaliarchaeum desulfuricum TaxID=2055893 RepID=A0A343TKR2_9EURY|nr:hypothetical protein [Halalkaliarchaeum desulfuricum]AUX09684.1 hypothetical protein AArcSl_2059 [Halalkaliarchaeum desulfuricum]